MQPELKLFDTELLALVQETRRVAESIDDCEISARLIEIADDILGLAYLGDRSNKDEFAEALRALD